MEFSLQYFGSYEESLKRARWAEKNGFVSFAVADHYLAGSHDEAVYDNLVLLAGLARETTSIELAVLVSPITFRHPAVLAKIAVTIDAMSGGRFALGVGAGWKADEHELFGLPYPSTAERFTRLEEALAYLRAAFSETPQGFDGKYYRLAEFSPQPKPQGQLPLIVGGAGRERTPDLAGRYADEYNVFPAREGSPAERVARARVAAGAAAREPSALRISTAFAPVVGRTEPEYRDRLTAYAELFATSPDEVEAELRALGVPHGSPEQAATDLGSLRRAGVSRIYLQAFGMSLEELEETSLLLKEAVLTIS